MNGAMNPFSRGAHGLRRIYIFGAGGHGREIAWLAEQALDGIELQFLVDHPKFLRGPVNGIPVRLLKDAEVLSDARFVAAIGDPAHRRAAVSACRAFGHVPAILIHPRTEVSSSVSLGQGSVICAGTVVTTDVFVGENVHINVGCTVSHDVTIGEFTTLSPGVHVSGNVHIGRDVFMGTGACIINGSTGRPLTIGDGAVVAAGACVISSIDPGALAAGVPAVRKR